MVEREEATLASDVATQGQVGRRSGRKRCSSWSRVKERKDCVYVEDRKRERELAAEGDEREERENRVRVRV